MYSDMLQERAWSFKKGGSLPTISPHHENNRFFSLETLPALPLKQPCGSDDRAWWIWTLIALRGEWRHPDCLLQNTYTCLHHVHQHSTVTPMKQLFRVFQDFYILSNRTWAPFNLYCSAFIPQLVFFSLYSSAHGGWAVLSFHSLLQSP